jgi:FMN phosphatase YigB (HAD superfamily)
MLKAILFDLDDTLLGNNMDTFIAHYFKLLGRYAQPILDEQTFIQYLLQATRAVITDTDLTRTNRQVFWDHFERLSGRPRTELEPFFGRFYEEIFPELQPTTQRRPVAADLVRTSFDRQLAVVIATNPLFPAPAIEQRLEWAGVPVTDFPYALVTTYENMHATKPQSAYYQEILSHINCPPESALMVGNDWKNDILPAAEIGLFTYWIQNNEGTPPDQQVVTGHGSLDALYPLLRDGWSAVPGG